ncbi:MAG: hypothetical protein IK955_05800 [Clostridia bacterium]|nr:hypothetical protein [Clostridia bacterium]
MANEPQKEPQKDKKSIKETILGIVALIVAAVIFFATCGGSGSNKSGKKWSDLSDQEKDNARWAYEAQKAIDEYER